MAVFWRWRPAPLAARSAVAQEPARLVERAHQDREIVYFLQPPETPRVRPLPRLHRVAAGRGPVPQRRAQGQHRLEPTARILDTGEDARGRRSLKGDGDRRGRARTIGEPVPPDAEVVVIRFPAGAAGRLGAPADPRDLHRSRRAIGWRATSSSSTARFGRPRNAVVLPAGWYLTASSIPARPRETADGRIRLDFVNPRPDEIAVLIKARRRTPTSTVPPSD